MLLKIGDFGLARFIQAKTINTIAVAGQQLTPTADLHSSNSHHSGTVVGKTPPVTASNGIFRLPSFTTQYYSNDNINSNLKRNDSVVSVKGLMIGTPGYTAPEGGALCTEKADVFSAALILLELLCPRFGTAMEKYKTLENFRTRQKVSKNTSSDRLL